MTDRELMELAAKAAGYWLRSEREPDFDDGKVWISDQDIDGVKYYPNWSVFDPLIDDGDALRLAVQLHLTIYQWSLSECCVCNESGTINESVSYGKDQLAATRRAIVRAAAEIGKAMQ